MTDKVKLLDLVRRNMLIKSAQKVFHDVFEFIASIIELSDPSNMGKVSDR